MRIGIDLMGENSPALLFEGVKRASEQIDHSHSLLVIATKTVVDQLKKAHPSINLDKTKAKIEFRVVADIIAMGDEPIGAVRRKKDASIVVGIRLLKKKSIDAFVSSGNTGALIASATLSLPKLPGIKRPALLAILPTQRGSVAVIDVGGNVAYKADHLVQFSQMGAAFQRCMRGVPVPVIGLLNIGVESRKGTTEVRKAYDILKEMGKSESETMHFLGNIEGKDVFQGHIDVLVTDGFTGNVLLKTIEGVSDFIFGTLSQNADISLSLKTALNSLEKHFNYAEYPGAIVCGVDGIVVKCHGESSSQAILSSIMGAYALVEKNVTGHLKQQLSATHQ